jgi:hypothetical protein
MSNTGALVMKVMQGSATADVGAVVACRATGMIRATYRHVVMHECKGSSYAENPPMALECVF